MSRACCFTVDFFGLGIIKFNPESWNLQVRKFTSNKDRDVLRTHGLQMRTSPRKFGANFNSSSAGTPFRHTPFLCYFHLRSTAAKSLSRTDLTPKSERRVSRPQSEALSRFCCMASNDPPTANLARDNKGRPWHLKPNFRSRSRRFIDSEGKLIAPV